MAWFKVDDGFYTSHKVLQIPRQFRHEAVGAWLMVGVWSADKMTDGVVPSYIVDDFNVSDEALHWLCEAGLWIKMPDGIKFHDWAEYQPTRGQLEEKRDSIKAARSEAGIKSGEARRTKLNKTEQNGNKTGTKLNPEPEPEPEPITSNEVINSFDDFWKVYPRHEAKATALKAWAKAVKKVPPHIIIDSAQALAESPYRPDVKFIPHGATWLNQERWNDPLPSPPQNIPVSAAQKNLATVAYFQNLENGGHPAGTGILES